MTEAVVRWTENDRYVGEAGGHEVALEAGGEKSAISPMELVLIALCGCSASDVVNILRKKREPFTSLEAHAEAERAETFPRVYTHIRLTYRVGGKSPRKRWKMPCVCRKRNTARYRRCWRRPLRSMSSSSMLSGPRDVLQKLWA